MKNPTKKVLSKEHREKVVRTLNHSSGPKNNHWRGGRSMKDGYVVVRAPNHPHAYPNGYYPEHRLVMEKVLGRVLTVEEIVHHINGNKEDNRPENLLITNQERHTREHWTKAKREKHSRFMSNLRQKRFWSTRKSH